MRSTNLHLRDPRSTPTHTRSRRDPGGQRRPFSRRHSGPLRLLAGLAISTAAMLPLHAWAAEATFQSNHLAPDARWQALSGAVAATGDGLSGARGNPAGLATLDGPRSAFSHLAWPGDLSREWVGLGIPFSGDVRGWLDVSVLHGPELQGFDVDGNPTGGFAPAEWNAGGAVGFALPAGFDAGVGVRYFRLEDPSDPVSGVGVSAGLRWESGSRSFGASVTDLGEADGGDAGTYALPWAWRVGLRQLFGRQAALHLAYEDGPLQGPRGIGGLVFSPLAWAELYGGMEMREVPTGSGFGWSTGASVTRNRVTLSYAFRSLEALDAAHQFGIELPLR